MAQFTTSTAKSKEPLVTILTGLFPFPALFSLHISKSSVCSYTGRLPSLTFGSHLHRNQAPKTLVPLARWNTAKDDCEGKKIGEVIILLYKKTEFPPSQQKVEGNTVGQDADGV